MPDLLIELFSEEIPARMQRRAAADLKARITDGLVEAGLTYAGAVAHCTPRRLTLSLHDLTDASPTTTEERKGPRVDAPEKALEGFLRGAGLTKDQLTVVDDKKGQIYVAKITNAGRPAAVIVAEVLEQTIRNFPWPKSMRWGDGSLKWVRPLRSILCVLTREDGTEIVPLDIDSIVAGDTTEGHRFMAPGRFRVASFDDYEAKLKRANVVLSSEERADHIWHDATNQAFAAGLEVVEDAGLLAEVAGLVEWPVVLMGKIDDAFLDLPPEVLQTSMKEHQKFFSVRDKTRKIVRFITVANRATADDGATILAGNNRVLSARLADAKFFWENDLRVAKSGMEKWTEALSNVTFHAKLGSQAERIDRIMSHAADLSADVDADAEKAIRAAYLAKADLSSEMVYEFPELQGVMGRYYAENISEPEEVALAVAEHYSPLGPSDEVPTAPVSVTVALADKLDTLTSFWAIDEKPTGSKDPYALRRAALGVIRLVLVSNISLSLSKYLYDWVFSVQSTNRAVGLLISANRIEEAKRELKKLELLPEANQKKELLIYEVSKKLEELRTSHEEFKIKSKDGADNSDLAEVAATDLLSFFHDRLKQHLKSEGIRHDVIDAVLTGDRTDDLANVTARARALNAFLSTDDGENLTQGYKRAKNILDQAEAKDGVEYSYGADRKLTDTEEERALFDVLAASRPAITAALKSEDYPAAMTALAGLRAPIDAFFEAVQVNSDNDIVRRNRLNMLSEIVRACADIADLGKIGS